MASSEEEENESSNEEDDWDDMDDILFSGLTNKKTVSKDGGDDKKASMKIEQNPEPVVLDDQQNKKKREQQKSNPFSDKDQLADMVADKKEGLKIDLSEKKSLSPRSAKPSSKDVKKSPREKNIQNLFSDDDDGLLGLSDDEEVKPKKTRDRKQETKETMPTKKASKALDSFLSPRKSSTNSPRKQPTMLDKIMSGTPVEKPGKSTESTKDLSFGGYNPSISKSSTPANSKKAKDDDAMDFEEDFLQSLNKRKSSTAKKPAPTSRRKQPPPVDLNSSLESLNLSFKAPSKQRPAQSNNRRESKNKDNDDLPTKKATADVTKRRESRPSSALKSSVNEKDILTTSKPSDEMDDNFFNLLKSKQRRRSSLNQTSMQTVQQNPQVAQQNLTVDQQLMHQEQQPQQINQQQQKQQQMNQQQQQQQQNITFQQQRQQQEEQQFNQQKQGNKMQFQKDIFDHQSQMNQQAPTNNQQQINHQQQLNQQQQQPTNQHLGQQQYPQQHVVFQNQQQENFQQQSQAFINPTSQLIIQQQMQHQQQQQHINQQQNQQQHIPSTEFQNQLPENLIPVQTQQGQQLQQQQHNQQQDQQQHRQQLQQSATSFGNYCKELESTLQSERHAAALKDQQQQLQVEFLKSSLEDVKQRHKNELVYLEETHKMKASRSQTSYERRIEELEDWKACTLEEHKTRMTSLREEHRQEIENWRHKMQVEVKSHAEHVERINTAHRKAIDDVCTGHARQLEALRRSNETTVEHAGVAQDHSVDLQSVVEEVRNTNREVTSLQQRVGGTLDNHLSQRELALKARAQQLDARQKRVQAQEENNEGERARLQTLVAKMEVQLSEQTRQIEQDKWRLVQDENRLKTLQTNLEEERRSTHTQLSRERDELRKSRERMLDEQSTIVSQCYEERKQLNKQVKKNEITFEDSLEEVNKLASIKEKANRLDEREEEIREAGKALQQKSKEVDSFAKEVQQLYNNYQQCADALEAREHTLDHEAQLHEINVAVLRKEALQLSQKREEVEALQVELKTLKDRCVTCQRSIKEARVNDSANFPPTNVHHPSSSSSHNRAAPQRSSSHQPFDTKTSLQPPCEINNDARNLSNKLDFSANFQSKQSFQYEEKRFENSHESVNAPYANCPDSPSKSASETGVKFLPDLIKDDLEYRRSLRNWSNAKQRDDRFFEEESLFLKDMTKKRT